MTTSVDLLNVVKVLVEIDRSSAPNVRTLFDAVARAFVRHGAIGEDRRELVVDALMARETQGTTALGYGLAIPHATLEGLPGICLAVVKHGKGIDFGAADGEPVTVMTVLLTPLEKRADYLRLLGHIASVARDRAWRRLLLGADDAKSVAEVLWDAPVVNP
jgi:PTS system nitrogen regulatory IIA component